jgi:DNA-binding winged helix-turn-helix (wHTH) protein
VVIEFPPFQLDVSGWQLRRDGKPVPLRPKSFAFLQYLAERPGELVTKRALLDAVWPGVAVTEDVLRLSARELRAALGDQATAPRYIATVPRLGYRFIATMGPAAMAGPVAAAPADVDDDRPTHGLVVGRERERAEIATWLRAATGGRRQLGFVTTSGGRPPPMSGSRAVSASSSTAVASPTCRCWKRSPSSGTAPRVRRSRKRFAATRPAGSWIPSPRQTPIATISRPGAPTSTRSTCWRRPRRRRFRCTDGDPTCDRDGLCNDSCLFRARLCTGSVSGAMVCPAPPLERLHDRPPR